jgi:hypothetical protein
VTLAEANVGGLGKSWLRSGTAAVIALFGPVSFKRVSAATVLWRGEKPAPLARNIEMAQHGETRLPVSVGRQGDHV